MKKKPKPPFRLRMKRKQRLRIAPEWMQTYEGEGHRSRLPGVVRRGQSLRAGGTEEVRGGDLARDD